MASIYPIESVGVLTPLERMERMDRMEKMLPIGADDGKTVVADPQNISFLDIFKGLITNVVETNEQVDRDTIDIMLGNIDDLATVQAHINKSLIAVDTLVSVKNEVLSTYNSIINMQI